MSESPLVLTSSPRRALRASLFLITIECVLLAYTSKSWLVPGGLLLWGTSRWWTVRRGWCMSVPVFWNALFLAVLFVVKFAFFPAKFPSDAEFVNTELAHEIGCWLVSLQILFLHEASSLQRIRPVVAALGCVVVLCAGDLQLHSVSRSTMLGLVISFVGGLAWFAHAGRDWIKLDQRRRLRRGIMLATLVLAGVPTVFAAQAWQRHERDLEMLLIRMVQMLDGNQRDQRTRVRSALVQVSNGKLIEPEKLVLQVTQNSSQPLYLRGSVFNAYPYRTSTWVQERTNPVDLNPSPVPPGLKVSSKERVFQISSASSAPWTTATITYLAKDDPVPLAPLQTTLMQLNVSQLRIDTLGNLSLREESLPDTLTDYIPVSPGTDAPPEPDDPTRKLPATLDPRILAIAQTVFAGKTSDAEKIRAVEAYFRENFLYQLGWEPPPNVDPLTCFLVDRIPAHCEYFASGAAILLRTGGVPTRYITGYVPSEQHPGGVWIARRKDAHAWVEAYDAGLQRWVTVEPTPSQGLPERRTATWRNSFDEAWRVWSTRFRERLAKFGVLSAMLMVLESTITRVLLGVVLLAGWWGLSRRFRRRVATPRNAMTPRTFPFQQWLRLLESELEQRGFQRQPQETLLQFRDRILASPGGEQLRATAEWYAEYSSIRYNEAEQTDARVAALELSWQGLASKTGASTGVPSPNRK